MTRITGVRMDREPAAVIHRLRRLLAQRRRELQWLSLTSFPIGEETGSQRLGGISRGRWLGGGDTDGRLGRRGWLAEDADDRRGEVARGCRPGAGDRVEQVVEGRLAVATVERLECTVADAGLDQPDPGGDALGGEIALVALDGRQGLVLRPSLQPRLGPARPRCRPAAAPARRPRATRARRRQRAARRLVSGPSRRTTPRPSLSARRRRTRRRWRRRGRPSPPGSPARRTAPPAPGWRRRRPWPAPPCRRARPRPLPAPVSASGTARTTRPRSRPPPAPRASARPPPLEARLAHVDRHQPQIN